MKFASASIAEDVLYQYGRFPQKFTFKTRRLKIDRCKKSQQTKKAMTADQSVGTSMANVLSLPISNVYYGTLIVGTAMKNITGADGADDFGFIAHRLVDNERNKYIRLRIDHLERTFSVVISSYQSEYEHTSTSLSFEWPFSA